MPTYYKADVEGIEANHGATFPHMHLTVGEEDHSEADRDYEEDDIADETLPADLELANESHGAGNNSSDKAGRTYQLPDSHAAAVRVHGSEGAEDIGRAITKRQEGDARQAFGQPKYASDSAEVDTEEIARSDADGREQQAQPEGQKYKGHRFCKAKRAVVEGEI